ncbi:uncharacterized protein OCT59_025268 [Rhizophagus irregularis]|uniref:uncharacterized protein n=1 Tax=Rhizophagus irregularis TaxID=588596 RepID=UPI003330F8B4|nr:hypothetical protein OCT59_025268 [Rhizophagus irregularis]
MLKKFFSKLSQNYIKLLEDDEYYDIKIEAGEDPYIILKYIYGGFLSLNEQDTSDILKILAAADELCLQELIDYLQGDDLQMKEVEVWEHVLEWGLAKNSTFIPDPDTWTDDDFNTMKNTLQNCLPLIRFYCLSSQEFVRKVRPYKKLLKHQLYENLVNSYMDPDNGQNENILFPRNIKINSRIVDLRIISIISRWIDNNVTDNKFAYIRDLYLPYKFKLLLRGSRDGLTPKKFHELCDGKSNTVTFIKVRGTDEIIGGYNPIKWESNYDWGEAKDSFIFSLKSNDIFFKDGIISNIEVADCALWFSTTAGPCFGDDINIYASYEFTNYDEIHYQKRYYYEKRIRDDGEFFMEDYEVYQIIRE